MKIINPAVLGVKPVKCENERYENQENDSREEKEEVQKLNFFRSKSIMWIAPMMASFLTYLSNLIPIMPFCTI